MQQPLHKWREQDNHILMYVQPNGQWLESIKFKLPIIEEDMEMSLDDDKHVETIVLLGRENLEDVEYAYLDYEPSKNIQVKGGATYSEIKDWILEQYGLKVSSFYVAQIKDKCGIKG